MFDLARIPRDHSTHAEIVFDGFPNISTPPRVTIKDFSNADRCTLDCADIFSEHFYPDAPTDGTIPSVIDCRGHLIEAFCHPDAYTLTKLTCANGHLHLNLTHRTSSSKSISASADGHSLLRDRSSAVGLIFQSPGKANCKLTIQPLGEVLKVEYINPLIPYTCQLYPTNLFGKDYWELVFENFSI